MLEKPKTEVHSVLSAGRVSHSSSGDRKVS